MKGEELLLYLAVLSTSPAVAFVVHLILARLMQILRIKTAPLGVALIAVLCGYPVMAWAGFFLLPEPSWVEIFYGFLVYSGLAFSYFQLFGMTETARRIRILRGLAERGAVSRKDFQAQYGADNMLSLRLERLIAWKQIKLQNGRYVMTSRKLYGIARMIAFWANVLGFQKGGVK